MKYTFFFFIIVLIGISDQSCKKDEGNPPEINFKIGPGYTSSDTTVAANSILLVGIHAAKTEEQDVLKHFSVTLSINGGDKVTVDEAKLTGAQQDEYEVDYTFTVPTESGQKNKIIFSVTNRDGLTNQVSLTLTVK